MPFPWPNPQALIPRPFPGPYPQALFPQPDTISARWISCTVSSVDGHRLQVTDPGAHLVDALPVLPPAAA